MQKSAGGRRENKLLFGVAFISLQTLVEVLGRGFHHAIYRLLAWKVANKCVDHSYQRGRQHVFDKTQPIKKCNGRTAATKTFTRPIRENPSCQLSTANAYGHTYTATQRTTSLGMYQPYIQYCLD